jgi:hypothetical protein
MARPRVFVSSSYYDLKHFRSSLDIFIEGLGFETILSEKGNIAYNPDQSLDESCYRETQTADIFVLLIGGRYGSEVSGGETKPPRKFFERYESITKKEYESAIEKDIPTYILVEANVHAEYQTFLKNKEREDITYAHVDSANIFRFIKEILAKPRNNPTHTFERFSDIEAWLKEQWAGLFRDLLNRRSQQQPLTTLSSQVAQLKAIGDTLQKYLEAVVSKVTPEEAPKLIESEQKRLEKIELLQKAHFYDFLVSYLNLSPEKAIAAFREAKSFTDFCEHVSKMADSSDTGALAERMADLLQDVRRRRNVNEARSILGLEPLPDVPPKKSL